MTDLVREYLSGGSANTDPNLSLGGIISNTEITDQIATWETGYTVLFETSTIQIFGLAIGTAQDDTTEYYTLRHAGGILSLYKGASGLPLDVKLDEVDTGSVNDKYILNDGILGGITVDYVNTMPDEDWSFWVQHPTTNLFSDITQDESKVGKTDHRCMYFKNESGATLTFEFNLPVVSDSVRYRIGFDPAGVGGGATTVVDELAVPAGVTFSNPTLVAPLSAVIPTGSYQAVWIERIVDQLNTRSRIPSIINIQVVLIP